MFIFSPRGLEWVWMKNEFTFYIVAY